LQMRQSDPELLVFHSALLPVGFAAHRILGGSRPMKVFFHGVEIWKAKPLARRLWKSPSVEMITVSSFSAGALSECGFAKVLPPSVPAKLYTSLLGVTRRGTLSPPMRILSVFRLDDYDYKGGPELVSAVNKVRDLGIDVELTIAGKEPVPDSLEFELSRHDWMRIVRSPAQDHLVECYEAADLFVLATRHRFEPTPAVEGFGIVLAEAALAGVPSIAPASGGGHDAILPGLTGVLPRDPSSDELAHIIEWCARNREILALAGQNARVWGRARFDPERYREAVVSLCFPTDIETDRWSDPGILGRLSTVNDRATQASSLQPPMSTFGG
jgi:phosphatidyl-myo-inositol dimannoside synthase